jgi:peptide/nickel transport system permease protein
MKVLLRMIVVRIAFGMATLLTVATLTFFGMDLQPGDAAQALLGRDATPESLAALRVELGLNAPVYIRYLRWLSDILHGRMGVSFANKRHVAELIGSRIDNTLFLAALAVLLSVPLSLLVGILAAHYRNSAFDRIVNIVSLSFVSFPEYFVGYIFIVVFSIDLGLFPSLTQVDSHSGLAARAYQTFLPALTLSLAMSAHIMRLTRAAILNVMSSPFVEMARLKGLSPLRIVITHVLPNSLGPIINVVVINLAYLVVGVVVVEVVFVYPGLGQLFVDAAAKRDFPVVQSLTLLFALTYIVLNLIADVLAISTNPKLLHSR